MTADAITFLRRGKAVSLRPQSPTQTVLDYLRLEQKLKGTKEGCNEGDCGACTVAVGRIKNGKLVYEPANACILLVGQLHACDLVVVDDLQRDGLLHPVQQAMVKHHASQCGYCTPGFVMSLFTLYHAGHVPTRAEIVDHLAGNLCRCTGYKPIVDAAHEACKGQALDQWAQASDETMRALLTIDIGDVFVEMGDGFLAVPERAESLARLAMEHPEATIVGGATDVGLWVTKQMRVLPKIIHTFNVDELHQVEAKEDHVSIGAAATYAEAFAALATLHPDISEVMRRLGSVHVRATGTIGGNIANGSPIGDSAPLLIALGATLHLRHGNAMRQMKLEDFFISYGKQARTPGELVWRVDVPKLMAKDLFCAFKISKRFDQDISALLMAVKIEHDKGRIVAARLAMGGMAATPKRAPATEAALRGVAISDESGWPTAIAALAKDYQPIADMRASAAYRMETAQALLRKALLEFSGANNTRILAGREAAA